MPVICDIESALSLHNQGSFVVLRVLQLVGS